MYTLTRLPSKGTAGRRSNMSKEQGGQKGYTVLTMSEEGRGVLEGDLCAGLKSLDLILLAQRAPKEL